MPLTFSAAGGFDKGAIWQQTATSTVQKPWAPPLISFHFAHEMSAVFIETRSNINENSLKKKI